MMQKMFLVRMLKLVLGLGLLWGGALHVGAAEAPEQNHGFSDVQKSKREWWNIPYPTMFDTAKLEQQDFISVKGNGFVDESGKPFIFRGVNIGDPDKLIFEKHWEQGLFAEVRRWGANTIRLPVHPIAWRQRGKNWYFDRIDEAVTWANKLGLYLIIDWHSIGNLEGGLYQHDMYITTKLETTQFWRSIALRYKNVPTVAVYELFNEPTDNFIGHGAGSLGKAEWSVYRETLESLIDIIYVYDKKVIPLVGGYNWAYDLTPIAKEPIRREGVAYAAHPYPQKADVKSKKALFKAWEKTWGFAAKKYPMINTELGWVKEGGYGAHVPVINNDGTYGPNIVEFMAERGISYTVWAFDPDWAPVMITDWDYTPSEQGAFFKKVMQAAEKADQAR